MSSYTNADAVVSRDPALLTVYLQSLTRCRDEDIDLDGLSRRAIYSFSHDQLLFLLSNVEETRRDEVPLKRKRSTYRRARQDFHSSLKPGKVPMPDLDIPARVFLQRCTSQEMLSKKNNLVIILSVVSSKPLSATPMAGSAASKTCLVQLVLAVKFPAAGLHLSPHPSHEPSPSSVSTDQIPIDVLMNPIRDINEFYPCKVIEDQIVLSYPGKHCLKYVTHSSHSPRTSRMLVVAEIQSTTEAAVLLICYNSFESTVHRVYAVSLMLLYGFWLLQDSIFCSLYVVAVYIVSAGIYEARRVSAEDLEAQKAKKSARLMMEKLVIRENRQRVLATVKVKTVDGEVQLQALVDRNKIIITESTMRRDLQLEDAESVDCLPNATIFEQLALMGYEQVSQKLTFYKAFFSPQWKFLIHTVLQFLSPKTTAWN
ncbi:hypothetical protein Tco_0185691 [Tanacetum coccineum]